MKIIIMNEIMKENDNEIIIMMKILIMKKWMKKWQYENNNE